MVKLYMTDADDYSEEEEQQQLASTSGGGLPNLGMQTTSGPEARDGDVSRTRDVPQQPQGQIPTAASGASGTKDGDDRRTRDALQQLQGQIPAAASGASGMQGCHSASGSQAAALAKAKATLEKAAALREEAAAAAALRQASAATLAGETADRLDGQAVGGAGGKDEANSRPGGATKKSKTLPWWCKSQSKRLP